MIIQHFEAYDLLNMSEVSPNWYQLTETHKIDQKVKLNLRSSKTSMKRFGKILDSTRNYKTIAIDHCYFRPDFFLSIIERFSKSVEDLTIAFDSEVSAYDSLPISSPAYYESFPKSFAADAETFQKINFVELKTLFLSQVTFEMENLIMFGVEQAGNKLEEFTWIENSDYNEYQDAARCLKVMRFILKQKNLKRLDIASSISPIIFKYERDRSRYMDPLFKLEDLRIRLNDSYDRTFLLSQRHNLQKLSAIRVSFEADLITIIGMKKLQSLEILCDYGLSFDSMILAYDPNTSIVDLKFSDTIRTSRIFAIKQRILRSLPELRRLELSERLSIDMMEFIATNMMKLETLTYTSAEDGALQRYENMQIEQPVNMNIQIIEKRLLDETDEFNISWYDSLPTYVAPTWACCLLLFFWMSKT